MKLKISLPTYILMLVMTAVGLFNELICYFISVVIHELAHARTAKKLGYEMEEIKLMPYGAALVGDVTKATPVEEIKIALVGPLVSFVLYFLTVSSWWIAPTLYPYTESFARINICLAITNLLPVYPLDGGRIILALLSIKLDRKRSYKGLRIFGCIVAVVLAVIFFILKNFSVATLSLFLIASTLFPPPECKYARVYELVLDKTGKEVRVISVLPSTPTKNLLRYFRRDKITRFEVFENGALLGVVDEREFYLLPSETFLNGNILQAYKYLQKAQK